MSKDHILREFKLFSLGTDGIGGWLGPGSDDRVFQRLALAGSETLTKVQLNQLLAFGHEAPVSDDFFRYYWLSDPAEHPYDVKSVPECRESTPTRRRGNGQSVRWNVLRGIVFSRFRTGLPLPSRNGRVRIPCASSMPT